MSASRFEVYSKGRLFGSFATKALARAFVEERRAHGKASERRAWEIRPEGPFKLVVTGGTNEQRVIGRFPTRREAELKKLEVERQSRGVRLDILGPLDVEACLIKPES